MSTILKDYPFKRLTDSRTAMTKTLADFVKLLTFRLPRSGTSFRFEDVYEEWAGFEARASGLGRGPPIAAVLPDRPVPDSASFGPRLIEETWSGGDPETLKESGKKRFPIGDGSGDGFALYEVAQREARFLLLFRCSTKTQRRAIFTSLEEAFIEDGSLLDPASLNPDVAPPESMPDPPIAQAQIPDAAVQPVRYGRLLKVSRYFDRTARFTIVSGPEPLDTEASAHENRWMGQVEILGHMQICTLRRVRGMKPRVELVVDDVAENR